MCWTELRIHTRHPKISDGRKRDKRPTVKYSLQLKLATQENASNFPQMSKSFRLDIVNNGDTLVNEFVRPVVDAFDSAYYYDNDFNIVSIKSRKVLMPASEETRAHAQGKLDPKTREPYPKEEQEFLDDFNVAVLGSDAVHNDASFVESHRIPDNFETLTTP